MVRALSKARINLYLLLLAFTAGFIIMAVEIALLAGSIIPRGHKPADFGMRIIFDGKSPVQHVRVIEGSTQEGVIRFLQLQEGGGILHSIYSSYADPMVSYGVWNWLA